MMSPEQELTTVLATIEDYFQGVFQGDLVRLRRAFHPQCQLRGEIHGEPYLKSLEEYLEGVANRKSPQELGEIFRMKVISLDLLETMAVAKVHLPMLGYNYYDFLTLMKMNDEWVIVNKLFIHLPLTN